MPFGPRLPEIFSLFVAHVFLVVGSCVSRPAVLQPRSILELFVPLNRFLFVWSTWGNVWWWIEPEKYFGFCGFLVVCSNWEFFFFFCHVLDLRKCLLVKKKIIKKINNKIIGLVLTAAERHNLVLRLSWKRFGRASVPVLREILTVLNLELSF